MSSFLMEVEEQGEVGVRVAARALSAGYRRRGKVHLALRGFTAAFHPGITGLIGPNGAGKTTLLRVISGLLQPSEGSVDLHGSTPEEFLASRGLGFLPENPPLPPYLKVGEFLEGLDPEPGIDRPAPKASSHGSPNRLALRVRSLWDQRLNALSLGQKKAVALSAALLGRPSVLLLDEPTNGLDPLAVRELRASLLEERGRGRTLIVSSHHLDELQRMADFLVFMREGRVIGGWLRDRALEEFGTLEALFDRTFQES